MKPADLATLEITTHAADRFWQRGGTPLRGRAEAMLLDMAARAFEIEPPTAELARFEYDLRHGDDPSFWKCGGWVLVIQRSHGCSRVVTVFHAQAGDLRFAKRKGAARR